MSTAEALRTRWRIVVGVVVVLLILGLSVWLLKRPTPIAAQTPAQTSAPSKTSAVSVTTAPPATSAPPPPSIAAPLGTTSPAAAAGCPAVAGSGFVPDRFTMDRPKADERVLSLGIESDGTIAAPPKNQPRTAAWWNGGPRPGSDQGKVVMSIHTYRTGDALGNEMYQGGQSQLKPGDLIKLYGPGGKVACYQFVEAKKIWVKDYDSNSDILVDFNGAPMLTIVICWDFNKPDEVWRSRIFFYAKPFTG